jgi:hypothetical protein
MSFLSPELRKQILHFDHKEENPDWELNFGRSLALESELYSLGMVLLSIMTRGNHR